MTKNDKKIMKSVVSTQNLCVLSLEVFHFFHVSDRKKKLKPNHKLSRNTPERTIMKIGNSEPFNNRFHSQQCWELSPRKASKRKMLLCLNFVSMSNTNDDDNCVCLQVFACFCNTSRKNVKRIEEHNKEKLPPCCDSAGYLFPWNFPPLFRSRVTHVRKMRKRAG